MLIWLPMQRVPPSIAPILFVPGLLYEALVRARNGLYGSGMLPRRRLPGSVISVGNITMGGTGKTPLVLCIAQILAKQGFHPAILSRGYKRAQSNTDLVLPPQENIPCAARVLGDEPALIRRHIPSAWMGISKDRYRAGSRIAQDMPQAVFILDDGFQHRSLYRDLDIVILDRSQPPGHNRMFPRGTLREPISGLSRCHVVVINGAHEGSGRDPIAEDVARYNPKAPCFCCRQKITSLVPFTAWSGLNSAAQPLKPQSAFLVAAIGNPGRFEQDVRRFGIDVKGSRFFPDHYWLQPNDWGACVEEARSKGALAIIVTEKDAVKIPRPPDFPLMVSMQSTEISDRRAFEAMLIQCAGRRWEGGQTG